MWCRDTLTDYASTVNTSALSRAPSPLMGMISRSSVGFQSVIGLAFPPSDTFVMSPGPGGGCKDLFKFIPLDAVLHELKLLLEESRTSTRSLSELVESRPSSPLSFHSTTSSSGTISSFTPAPNYSFAQHPAVAFSNRSNAGLSPMQQVVVHGSRSSGASLRSVGRARAGSFAVRGIA